ncbi:uncharacterized protein LOC106156045 isoform X1 [Lingula anatina]|uniref:Uncharacterized protein LOC106156045 isoform X1 n=1 Tax=Lingula anatina TaxID=7574 RepID=A0A1S3HKN7_LINAN|nr:uncharacterized protein LOC106156045 isoform X1 [Lingula anatina]|eukprot:XP_013386582.1 uncharacterized protein LOC106156045 isoform X1 [Lingula anatina]
MVYNGILLPKSEIIAVGKTVSKYYRFLSKSGDWVWVQSKATILYNSNSQPQSVVCISQLISEAEVKRSLASENKKAIEYAVPGANLTELTATSSGRDTNQSGFAGQNGSVDSTPVSNTRKQPLPSSDSQSSTSSLSSRDSEPDAQPVFKKPRLDKMNVRTQSMLMSPEVDFAVVDDVFKIGMPLEEPLPPFCSDTETNLESPGGYLSDANSDNSMGFDVPSGKRSSKQRDNNPYMSYDSPGINFSSTSTGETSLNSNSVSSDAFSSFGPYRSCTSSTPSPTLNALNQTNSQLYLAKTNTITANTSSQDDNQPSELRRLLLEGRQKKKQKSDSSVRKSDQQLEAEKPVLASLLQGKLDLSKAHIPAPVVNDQPRQQQKQNDIHSQRTVHSSIGDGLGKDNFNDFGNTSSQGFQNINATNHPSQSWSPVDMSLLDSMETLLDQENLLVDYYYSSLLMNDEIPPEPSTTGQQCVQQSSDSASPPMSTHSLQSPQGSLFGSPQGPAQQNYGSSNSPLMSPQGWAQMSPGGTVISNQVPNVNMQVPTSPSLQRSSKYSSQGSCSSSSSSVHSAMSPPGLQTLRSPYSSQACSPSPTRSRHSTGGGSLSEEICDEIFAGSSPPSVPHIVAPAGRPLQGSSGQVVDINFGDPLLSDTSLHGQESQESFESDVMAFEELLRSSSPHSQASSACEGVEEVVRGFINSPWSQENPDKLIINSVNGPSLKKLLHC